jgi:hypothetical protein
MLAIPFLGRVGKSAATETSQLPPSSTHPEYCPVKKYKRYTGNTRLFGRSKK